MKKLIVIQVVALCMLFGCASAWKKARKTNTIDGYLAFIKQKPNSPNVEDSRREIRALLEYVVITRLKRITIICNFGLDNIFYF